MKKSVIFAGLACLGLAACSDPYDPGQRAIGGALIGGGSGAAIGAIAGGGEGAAIGALAGSAVGAGTGYITTPRATQQAPGYTYGYPQPYSQPMPYGGW